MSIESGEQDAIMGESFAYNLSVPGKLKVDKNGRFPNRVI